MLCKMEFLSSDNSKHNRMQKENTRSKDKRCVTVSFDYEK
jgi:hypothetical protein